MDGGAGAPAEPEEADGDEEGADHGGREALFGFELAASVELGFDVFVEVVEERGTMFNFASEWEETLCYNRVVVIGSAFGIGDSHYQDRPY